MPTDAPSTVIERLFALSATPPFAGLDHEDLALIAAAAGTRRYAAGETVALRGHVLSHLFVVVDGSVVTDHGVVLPPVFGEASLLFGTALAATCHGAPDRGATCILIRRSHFFTMVNECPSLLVGLLATRGGDECMS